MNKEQRHSLQILQYDTAACCGLWFVASYHQLGEGSRTNGLLDQSQRHIRNNHGDQMPSVPSAQASDGSSRDLALRTCSLFLFWQRPDTKVGRCWKPNNAKLLRQMNPPARSGNVCTICVFFLCPIAKIKTNDRCSSHAAAQWPVCKIV